MPGREGTWGEKKCEGRKKKMKLAASDQPDASCWL